MRANYAEFKLLVKVRIVGRLCIGAMRHGWSGWRWKRVWRGRTITGVADEGIPFRSIAEVIGGRLNVLVGSISNKEAAKQFSFLAGFAATDNPSTSNRTREQLGWEPARWWVTWNGSSRQGALSPSGADRVSKIEQTWTELVASVE